MEERFFCCFEILFRLIMRSSSMSQFLSEMRISRDLISRLATLPYGCVIGLIIFNLKSIVCVLVFRSIEVITLVWLYKLCALTPSDNFVKLLYFSCSVPSARIMPLRS